MKIDKVFFSAYLDVISKLEKSGILEVVSHRTQDTEDAYDLLFLSVTRLASIYDRILKEDKIDIDSTMLKDIASDSNAIWYAIDCRNDIPAQIPKTTISLAPQTCDILSSKLEKHIPSQMNINDIHSLAGDIEMFIQKEYVIKL